jgi:Niemann-Pick C1 protein
VGDTYSYSQQMSDLEQYVVFVQETMLSVGLSILAVFFVVMFITGSVPVTLLVVLAVLLVDLYLLALIHFWDLTMNNIIVVNLVIGLGLSVDYSAHIAHSYLMVKPPKELTENADKRMFKARVAVSSMGSSVIHGGISTFLAIIVLSSARSYIFVVFFRLWFGIIVFGMSNGFILLPIIFTLIGPVSEDVEMEFEL